MPSRTKSRFSQSRCASRFTVGHQAASFRRSGSAPLPRSCPARPVRPARGRGRTRRPGSRDAGFPAGRTRYEHDRGSRFREIDDELGRSPARVPTSTPTVGSSKTIRSKFCASGCGQHHLLLVAAGEVVDGAFDGGWARAPAGRRSSRRFSAPRARSRNSPRRMGARSERRQRHVLAHRPHHEKAFVACGREAGRGSRPADRPRGTSAG